MFYQGIVNEEDTQDNVKQEPKEYWMTVFFGAVSFPSCASFAFTRTAEDNQVHCSLEVVETVGQNFPVDGCLNSLLSEEGAVMIVQMLTGICQRKGFTLTKWSSHIQEVLQTIEEKHRPKDWKEGSGRRHTSRSCSWVTSRWWIKNNHNQLSVWVYELIIMEFFASYQWYQSSVDTIAEGLSGFDFGPPIKAQLSNFFNAIVMMALVVSHSSGLETTAVGSISKNITIPWGAYRCCPGCNSPPNVDSCWSHYSGVWEFVIQMVRKVLASVLHLQTLDDDRICTVCV